MDEGLEEPCDDLGRHSDAGIPHHKLNLSSWNRRHLREALLDGELDFTYRGELGGVGEEVDDDLGEAVRVAEDESDVLEVNVDF